LHAWENLPSKEGGHFFHKLSLDKRSAKAGNARSSFVVGKCQAAQTAQIDTVVSGRQICVCRKRQILAPVCSTNSIIVYGHFRRSLFGTAQKKVTGNSILEALFQKKSAFGGH